MECSKTYNIVKDIVDTFTNCNGRGTEDIINIDVPAYSSQFTFDKKRDMFKLTYDNVIYLFDIGYDCNRIYFTTHDVEGPINYCLPRIRIWSVDYNKLLIDFKSVCEIQPRFWGREETKYSIQVHNFSDICIHDIKHILDTLQCVAYRFSIHCKNLNKQWDEEIERQKQLHIRNATYMGDQLEYLYKRGEEFGL